MHQTRCSVRSGSYTVRDIELNPPATSRTASSQASLGMRSEGRKHINVSFIIKLQRRATFSLIGILVTLVFILKVATGNKVLHPS